MTRAMHDIVVVSDLHIGRGRNPATRRFHALETFFFDDDLRRWGATADDRIFKRDALEVEAVEPGFTVTCDDDKVGVLPGGAAPWFVRVARTGGFTGAVTVRAENLPPGMSADPCVLPPGQNDGLLLLRAKAGAAPAASAVRLVATGEGLHLDARSGRRRRSGRHIAIPVLKNSKRSATSHALFAGGSYNTN